MTKKLDVGPFGENGPSLWIPFEAEQAPGNVLNLTVHGLLVPLVLPLPFYANPEARNTAGVILPQLMVLYYDISTLDILMPLDPFQFKCEVLDPLSVGTTIDEDVSVSLDLKSHGKHR